MSGATPPQQTVRPPVARRAPSERVHHGDTFVDDYEWLRDKESPDTIAYLEAENAYMTARTAHLEPLRESIFSEIKNRTQETDLSVPVRMGGWWYYSRTVEGKQYGLSCRMPATDGGWLPPPVDPETAPQGEQVLLDLNELADGHDFFSLGASSVTPDGHLLAFSTDVVGDERFLLQVKDLRTGELLPDEIPSTSYGATWDLSGRYVFYTTVDDAWRNDKIWRHELGTDPSADVLVHHEADERFWVSIGRTRSDRLLVLGCGSKVTSEHRVLAADEPTGEFRIVAPRRQDIEYGVEHAVVDGVDVLLVLHNDGAENFELASVPLERIGSRTEWRPLLHHDPAVRLEDVDAFAGHVVVSQRSDGLTRLRLVHLGRDGVASDELLDMPDPLYTVASSGNPEFEQPVLRYSYTTMATPNTVMQVDLRT